MNKILDKFTNVFIVSIMLIIGIVLTYSLIKIQADVILIMSSIVITILWIGVYIGYICESEEIYK